MSDHNQSITWLMAGSELGLQWMTVPPVQELDAEKLIPAIKDMQEAINERNSDCYWQKVRSRSLLPKGNPQRAEQVKWNRRGEQMDRVLARLAAGASLKSNWSCIKNGCVLGLFVAGKCEGLLAMDKEESIPTVDMLVTHPGSEGGASILMERAVQKSEQWGYGGKLWLDSDNDNATGAYHALGFIKSPDDNCDLGLDPMNKPDIWCLHEGEWRIKKYIDKKFIG